MSKTFSIWVLSLLAVLVFPPETMAAKSEFATITVKGGGFLKNRAVKKQLVTLFGSDRKHFEASDIEDAALIALSSLQSEGYLNAETLGKIETVDGESVEGVWDKSFSFFLPRGLKAKSVVFELSMGPRFYYDHLEIEGDCTLDSGEIESFFYSSGFLLNNDKDRVFTKSSVGAAAENLQGYLKQLGYQNAQVKSKLVALDEASGAATVQVMIDQGSQHFVGAIVFEGGHIEEMVALDVERYKGKAFSRFVLQDIAKGLRNQYFEVGYPDASVKSKFSVTGQRGKGTLVEVSVLVEPGEKQVVASIGFKGQDETKLRLMERQLKLQPGDPLNPILLEESRVELSRLGIFRKVDYELSDSESIGRNLNFVLEERYPWTVDLIAGWGSYEELRGGVIAERTNLFGKAHRARFKGFASMKSSLADARYLIPDLWNSDTAMTSKLFVLNREEASFDREEFGFDVGLSKYIKEIDMDGDLIYTLQTLEPRNNELGGNLGNQDSKEVGSLELRFGRERRDNPLSPRSGYRTFGRFEWASKSLGGESEYQRLELGYSQHGKFSNGSLWHFGITHGGIAAFGADEDPANKLYFLGGENSIRGYQRGEASPKDSNGLDIGARSYALVNLEYEQLLNETLSVVLFGDALGQTSIRYEYTFDEYLYSLGLGLRLKTFMGPIRFEYGRNVEPRVGDPKGTFHFSIGYPF